MAKVDISLADCDPPTSTISPPDLQLIEAIQAAGLHPPSAVTLDGQIHRFASDINDPKDLKGWYVAYSDGIPAGKFGDHSTKEVHAWRADVGRELSLHEIVEHRRAMQAAEQKRATDRKLRQAERIKEAQIAWDRAELAHSHPYLSKKQIAPGIARIGDDGTLLLPIYNVDWSIQSLQRINNEGDKRFFGGAPFKGGYCVLGDWNTPVVYLVEGYATGSTVREKTGMTVVIAYSLNNLEPVYLSLKHKASQWVLIADNDKSGAGQTEGKRLEEKYGIKMVLPGVEGQDANDFVNGGGDLLAILPKIKAQKTIFDIMESVTADEFDNEYIPPDEIIEGLFTSETVAVLYGDSNSGKTFFALSLAAAVASGQKCYGREVDPGIVVYLAAEAPGSVKSRIQAIKKHYKVSLENLVFVPVPVNLHESNDDTENIIKMTVEYVQKLGRPVRLIIADTLSRVSAGADENTGKDMGPIMDRLERMARELRAALLAIHHTGKDAARGARGWSGIRAHISTEIEVTEKDGERKATITKQRELSSKGEEVYFALEVVEMGISKFGKKSTTCVAVPADAPAEIFAPISKEDAKISRHVKDWEDAWRLAGCCVIDDYPYLTKKHFISYHVEVMRKKVRTAENLMYDKDKLIGVLLASNVLKNHLDGWVMIDGYYSSPLMLTRGK